MKTNKNYLTFWVLIPFSNAAGLIFNKPLDIMVHDSYLVISSVQISILFSMILFVSGLGYFIFRNRTVNVNLTKAHIWFSLVGLMVTLTLNLLQYYVNRDTLIAEFVEYKNMEKSIQIMTGQIIGLTLLGLGFLSYLLNMIISTFKLISK